MGIPGVTVGIPHGGEMVTVGISNCHRVMFVTAGISDPAFLTHSRWGGGAAAFDDTPPDPHNRLGDIRASLRPKTCLVFLLHIRFL